MSACDHPGCTGVHDNNRYHELCPKSLVHKRTKDDRYYASNKGMLNRLRKTQWARYGSAAYAEMERWITGGELDELVKAAEASGDPGEFILRYTTQEVFGATWLTSILGSP